MRIHVLCIVKNEADIIEETLQAAMTWCDFVYVMDNGSTDATWQIVTQISKVLPGVVPFEQVFRPFHDELRDLLLWEFHHRARQGDWWGILDADEIYVDNPRQFLSTIPHRYNSVWAQLYTYLFTEKDLHSYSHHPELYDNGAAVKSLHYYQLGTYSPMRFFRHSMFAAHTGVESFYPVYPHRIRLKHFPYRSPAQIQLRLDTRREPMMRGEFVHEKRANWGYGTIVPGPASSNDIPTWEECIARTTSCHFGPTDASLIPPTAWEAPPPPSIKRKTKYATRRIWMLKYRSAYRLKRSLMRNRGLAALLKEWRRQRRS